MSGEAKKCINGAILSDWWEKILAMMPPEALTRPGPVVIVPFYDVDDPVGRNLSGWRFFGGGNRGFARLAAQRGFIAVATRWFGKPHNIGYLNHHKGHPPTPEADWRAVEWLAHFLGPAE